MPELGKMSLALGVRDIHWRPSSPTASPMTLLQEAGRGLVVLGSLRKRWSQGPRNTLRERVFLLSPFPFPILKAQSSEDPASPQFVGRRLHRPISALKLKTNFQCRSPNRSNTPALSAHALKNGPALQHPSIPGSTPLLCLQAPLGGPPPGPGWPRATKAAAGALHDAPPPASVAEVACSGKETTATWPSAHAPASAQLMVGASTALPPPSPQPPPHGESGSRHFVPPPHPCPGRATFSLSTL